jgi:16S rRNA processing protein RimM
MGEVLAPYGIRGWIKVRTHTEEPAALLRYAVWRVKSPDAVQWQERALVAGRMHSGVLVAQLSGIASREAALALKGWQIGVPRAAMPAAGAGEVYWADLVGLAVVNRAGIALGTVAEVTAHGAHPLLRVELPTGSAGFERLIPYVPAIVERVDVAAGRIEVDWGEDY